MDAKTKSTDELNALRALCDASTSPEARQSLIESLRNHPFSEPEYAVVFQSIRALLSRGPFSLAQLRVHLNNRGFPDIDVEKYLPAAPDETQASRTGGNANS